MTARALRAVVDTERLKPTVVLSRVARTGTAVGLTHRMFRDLARELGGPEQAALWLSDLASETNRPIALNVPTGPDTSTTAVIAPRGWSEERTRGWVGGLHAELEDMFGTATLRGAGDPNRLERKAALGPNRAARRRGTKGREN